MFKQVIREIGFLLLWLTACTQTPPKEPEFSTVKPANLRPPAQNNGAIYQAGYDMRLFEDNKAMRVGDVLNITLRELTRANKADGLNSTKENSASGSAPMLFGMPTKIDTELSATREFKGLGTANQSNSLNGNISVTVVEVLPNGNLRVRGEKRVTLNQGDEFIRLSGIVRPVDIDPTNTVASDKVADATIMYIGEGAIADSSKMGWLGRIFSSPWFPF